MAAGDIILSNGTTITAAEIQQIAAEVKKELAAESKELSQFEEVTSLANVSSLPGIQQSGATMKLVRVALEVLKGVDGKNIELTASHTAIQWRNVGESAWKTLVELSLLKGDKGDAGEKVMLRKGASGIEWKYANEADSAYKTLVSINDIKLKFSDLTDDDKAELTKIPILGNVTAENGATPSGNFTTDGYDSNGNPKYVLHLTVTKGDKGEPPVIEIGTVTTGLPNTDATAEVVPNGETEDGKPKFILNLTVPRGTPGQDGTGSGNVYVAETGLVSGKQYLFQPGANNSPNGVFVEYVPPSIPEQVQPDWNATEGKGAILNKPAILPEAPKDGKQYARKDGAWEEVEAGDELSKDAIEQALTGNITTHRHDTTYNYTDFETDVWDGTSISTSLQGSGTKDDPYLIQSCADWIHVYTKADQYAVYTEDNYDEGTEFKPVFKLMKNLDFASKDIDISSLAEAGNTRIFMCEFDGNHAKVSNFKTPVEGDTQFGVFSPLLVFAFTHDFVLDNIQIEINEANSTGLTLWGFPGLDLTQAFPLNNIIDLKVVFSGDIQPGPSEERISVPIICESGYFYYAIPGIRPVIDSYLQENGRFVGCHVTGVDGVTGAWELKADLIFASIYTVYQQAPVIYCTNSLSEIETPIQSPPSFVGNKVINVSYMIMGTAPSKLYTNSDGSNTIMVQDLEGENTTFTGTPKSLAEMKSASFVEELNSHLPKPAFRQDPDGGTPILAGGNATIAYDGYVKKSEFEAFKAKLSVDTPSEGSPFVDIEMASTNFPTDNDTVELTPEQYSIIDGGLKEGKMLRIKAKCGIFFGSTTTLIPFDASGDITPDKMEPSVLIWSTSSSVGIGSAHVKAVQMSVYISHTPNEAGNYVATFYKMKGDFVLSEEITTIKKLTQSEYDEISSKNSKTLYVIVG